ncbi:MAG: hypothetical protein ACOH5I_01200 [Oligoflexus sp.]
MTQLMQTNYQDSFPVMDLTGDHYQQFIYQKLVNILSREFRLLGSTLSLIVQLSSLEQEDRQKYELIEQQIRELSEMIEKLHFRIKAFGQAPESLETAQKKPSPLQAKSLLSRLTREHQDMISDLQQLDNALTQRPAEEKMLSFLRQLMMKHELMNLKLTYGLAA